MLLIIIRVDESTATTPSASCITSKSIQDPSDKEITSNSTAGNFTPMTTPASQISTIQGNNQLL